MPVLEVDLLYAYIDPKDRHHPAADRLLAMVAKRRIANVKLDALALHELELNLKAGNILIGGRRAEPRHIAEFFRDLSALLRLHGIATLPLSCEEISLAAELREKHAITFYDSHHAAAALLFDSRIVSTDKTYDFIENLERIDPYKVKEPGPRRRMRNAQQQRRAHPRERNAG